MVLVCLSRGRREQMEESGAASQEEDASWRRKERRTDFEGVVAPRDEEAKEEDDWDEDAEDDKFREVRYGGGSNGVGNKMAQGGRVMLTLGLDLDLYWLGALAKVREKCLRLIFDVISR